MTNKCINCETTEDVLSLCLEQRSVYCCRICYIELDHLRKLLHTLDYWNSIKCDSRGRNFPRPWPKEPNRKHKLETAVVGLDEQSSLGFTICRRTLVNRQ